MNLEKKATIVGAIWGLISILILILENKGEIIFSTTILKIITLPLFIAMTIQDPGQGAFLITFPLSIVIGAVLGYSIAKIYLKVKK